ncbi:hypothetical protein FOZ61_008683 [Perkinsus olseni]|uniref:Uncharacterized protein n=1 Tax=Perkinsus olseni TaxID=32597 RepID=A0A7J6M6H3_PEROL|nr:hypothetical protein FOZ61_008683 [Perkinsus olseni]
MTVKSYGVLQRTRLTDEVFPDRRKQNRQSAFQVDRKTIDLTGQCVVQLPGYIDIQDVVQSVIGRDVLHRLGMVVEAEILSDSRGVLLLSGASQYTYKLSSGASSAAAQTRILTGERTLCLDGSGSQKFGYIQVSPISKYFYAAIEADRDPGTAPTFVYFEGGPGGSSLTAALRQNGPCIRDFDTRRLRLNLYSWTARANGMRIDAPAPTGFSVGPVARGTEDFMLDLVDFITKFTQQNPIFNRDLHLVGTSSSAAFVAMLAARLAEKPQPQVHLAGVMLVSGVVSPIDIYRRAVHMADARNLLPKEELSSLKRSMRKLLACFRISKMTADLQQCDTQIGQWNSNGPGKPPISAFCNQAVGTCDTAALNPMKEKSISYYDVRVPSGQEETKYVLKSWTIDTLLNDQEIQQELGVSKKWEASYDEVYNAYNKYTTYNTTYFVTSLLDKGLKDYITNSVGAETWVLNLKGADKYGEKLRGVPRTPVKFGGVELGMMRALVYSNQGRLAIIEVTNTGHIIPLYKLLELQQGFYAYLSGDLWKSD